MPTIALVDDDENILASLTIFFEAEGYQVKAFHDGQTALAALTEAPPDIAVLDIKMPRMDGIEMLRRLRQASDLPVIFLTSKDEEMDEVCRLQCRRRRLHKKALLAAPTIRTGQSPAASVAWPRRAGRSGPAIAKTIVRGQLSLDPNRHSCTWKGDPVRLTVTEFLILQALANRPGFVKSRDQLMDAAYDDQVYVDDRTIDSHIKRLRKKFREVDGEFDAIETLYGVGYRYNEA